MQRFKVHSHSQAVSPTHRRLHPVASSSVQTPKASLANNTTYHLVNHHTYHWMGHRPQVSRHQIRFDEGLNRQYSPNYINPYQSTLGSAPGQDLSATLIELANIQSRSLEMMATSQRSQQEAFQELTRVSKDKSNDSMFTAIKTFDGTNRQTFEDWIDEVDQACRASNRGFRTELFKKSAGAVRQVILSCNNFSDDELVTKLRSCFSHAPTMNEAREELHNM